jgi:hypothetical protein
MYSKHFKCFARDDLLDDDVADDVDKIVQVHVLEDPSYTILPTGFRVINAPGKAPTPIMQVCTNNSAANPFCYDILYAVHNHSLCQRR